MSFADVNRNFNIWKSEFKKRALNNNISENTFDTVMANVKFLPKVIEYDRFQPEFYEDTKTYISKRASKKKVKSGIDFYKKNSKDAIDQNVFGAPSYVLKGEIFLLEIILIRFNLVGLIEDTPSRKNFETG